MKLLEALNKTGAARHVQAGVDAGYYYSDDVYSTIRFKGSDGSEEDALLTIDKLENDDWVPVDRVKVEGREYAARISVLEEHDRQNCEQWTKLEQRVRKVERLWEKMPWLVSDLARACSNSRKDQTAEEKEVADAAWARAMKIFRECGIVESLPTLVPE